MNESFYGTSFSDIQNVLTNLGHNQNLAKVVFDKLYKFKIPKAASTPTNLFTDLEKKFNFSLPSIVSTKEANDGTIKFLIEFADKLSVETVLIPFHKKYTVCLSSQVGCAMNCSFCFTGTQGLKRNLKTFEIISQYLIAYKYLKDKINPFAPSPNIVFMGQGEPLHNFDVIKEAITFFLDPKAFHLGSRQITLSTAGYLPGLKRFNELSQINLAISFHSASNLIRDELIPLNKNYPIENLVVELEKIILLKRQYITFEYLLIDELNNNLDDAEKLASIIKDKKIIVNLIPFNPFPGSKYKRPTSDQVKQFKSWLVSYRIRTMIRSTKGDDILAACGQLNTKN